MAKPTFLTGDIPNAQQVNDWLVNVNWARKLTNTDRASTITLADDPELIVPVAANAVYEIRSTLLVHSANGAAGDVKIHYTAPAGAVMQASVWGFDPTATTDNNFVGLSFSLNTTLGFGIVLVVDPWNPITTQGVLVNGPTAGVFTLQWAQNASSATVTRMMINSFINLQRVE